MNDFGIKAGYRPRLDPQYFIDAPSGITYQPDVYRAAINLARNLGVKHIIDIGSGNGLKLKPAEAEFLFVFIDFGENLQIIRKNMQQPAKHQFISCNLETDFPSLGTELLSDAVVICSDVIEHMVDPTVLVRGLKTCIELAPLVLISTPDRLRTHGAYQAGPPPNLAHVREWTLAELNWYLNNQGIRYLASGYTRSSDVGPERHTIVTLAGKLIGELLMIEKPTNLAVQLPAASAELKRLVEAYYGQFGLLPAKKSAKPVKLPEAGWLDCALPGVSVGQLLAQADKLDSTSISATVLQVQEPLSLYSQMDLNYRQPGRYLTIGGQVEIPLTGSGRPYPITAVFVLPQEIPSGIGQSRLIDGGSLESDYLLDVTAGLLT